MEIQMNFLSNHLKVGEFNIHFVDDFLSNYFVIIDKSKYLKKMENDILYNIYRDIEKTYQINKLYYENKQDFELFIKKAISSILKIQNKKEIIKIIPLIIYIDKNNLLLNYLLSKGFFNCIDTFFDKIVSNLDLKCASNTSELNWETEFLNEYKVGIKTLDFTKIYSFVELLENNRQFDPNKLVSFFIYCTYHISSKKLSSYLLHIKDTISLIYFIDKLSVHEKLLIADQTDNILLKVEVLRNSVYMKNNNVQCFILYEEEIKLVGSIINDISKNHIIWKSLLDYFICYPSRSLHIFKPIANVIHAMSKEAVDILINCIELSHYFIKDTETAINLFFFNVEDKMIKKEISKKMFNNWNIYIENFTGFLNTIILTSTISVVIYYIQNHMEKNKVSKEISIILDELNEIENNWYSDETERNSLLYKHISKIFVFSYSANKKEKKELREILLALQNEFNDPLTLNLFKDNTTLLNN